VGFGLRFDIGGNAGDCAADIGNGEFVGNDGTPAGGAELEGGGHLLLLDCENLGTLVASCIGILPDWAGWASEDWTGGLIFFDLVVWMQWLLIGLLVSVAALLLVAVAAARHILRQRRRQNVDSDVQAGAPMRPGTDTKPGEDV